MPLKGPALKQAGDAAPSVSLLESGAHCLAHTMYASVDMLLIACQVGPHDQLIMMRPTGLPANSYQPLQTPLQGDVGESWDPSRYKRQKDVPTGARHVTSTWNDIMMLSS